MAETKLNRREILAGAAGIGAGLLAATPRLKAQASSGVLGANERIVMAIIGSGGMGRHHMNEFNALGVKWAAVCDVYEPNRNEGLKLAGSGAEGYNEHERVLDRKDVDAVLIASPEHWHHDHLIATVQAGKDAYCEKPMSWSIRQGAEMVEAVRKTKQIVQIGMQRRSSPAIIEMKKLFDEKAMGDIHLVRAEWYWNFGVNPDPKLPGKLDWERFCGPAGKQEFEAIKFRSWRYYWPFSGGNVTDQGTHLMDVIQWMMGVEQPISALQFGDVYTNQPTETPDTFCCTFEYPAFTATWTLCYSNNTWRNGWSICFQGTKGSLFVTEDGWRFFKGVNGWEKGLPQPAKENMPGGLTSTQPHHINFLECVKSRKQPNATVEMGHRAVRTLHLANMALKHKTRAVLEADGLTVKV